MDKNFVTVYEVTRHYGGPEEGGWWYNWYEPVKGEVYRSFNQVEELRDEWMQRDEGNIYSVLGVRQYAVYIEEVQHEHATIERPHYE